MMYAIVEAQGAQFKVSKDLEVDVPRLNSAPGEKVTIENVLLIADKSKVLIGKPYIEGAKVEASVVSHLKEKKIVVFKYKSKKNYRKKTGHRQEYTRLLILDIIKPDGEIPSS
jgi:large subunit ribosomal protein L21